MWPRFEEALAHYRELEQQLSDPAVIVDSILDAIPSRPAWHQAAACRGVDPRLFFPEKGDPGRALDTARALCESCPVAAPCAEAGLREVHGVWAGTSPQQRRLLRRARRQAS